MFMQREILVTKGNYRYLVTQKLNAIPIHGKQRTGSAELVCIIHEHSAGFKVLVVQALPYISFEEKHPY